MTTETVGVVSAVDPDAGTLTVISGNCLLYTSQAGAVPHLGHPLPEHRPRCQRLHGLGHDRDALKPVSYTHLCIALRRWEG